MRTEDDLHDALRTLADDIPDPGQVLAAVHERTGDHRRTAPRRALLVAATAAAVAAIVAVPLLIQARTAEPEVQARPVNDLWRYAFTIDPPSGFTVNSRLVMRDYQLAMLTGPPNALCDIAVYPPGGFDTDRIPAARTAVTVKGRPGWFAEFGDPAASEPATTPRIAWEYAPDAWAVTVCQGGPGFDDHRAVEQKVADSVTFAAARFGLPFSVHHLPAGFETESASRSYPDGSTAPALGANADSVVHLRRTGDAVGGRKDRAVVLSYRKGAPSPGLVGGREITVNGRKAEVGTQGGAGGFPTVVIHGDGFEVVAWVGRIGIDEAELIRIAEGLEIASDPLDEATWFDARTALP